jgi:hypothetical protein
MGRNQKPNVGLLSGKVLNAENSGFYEEADEDYYDEDYEDNYEEADEDNYEEEDDVDNNINKFNENVHSYTLNNRRNKNVIESSSDEDI